VHDREQRLVQSVDRSLAILETLATADDLRLIEIAARTGLQPSTVHRLLGTLVARGYAVQSRPTGRYMLGYRLLWLAGLAGERVGRLRLLARPHLVSVREATGETANLSILAPPNSVYVEQVEGVRAVRMLAHIGAAVPAHASAAGKAMLAAASPDDLSQILGSDPLPALTPHTITSLTGLRQELEQVNRKGFAVDQEEHELGVNCVAAPVFDDHGAAAAISVSAPSLRIQPGDVGMVAEVLVQSARALSEELGYVGGASPQVGCQKS
jgi:IclR family acetate operon transcriptional repressor